MTHPATHAAGAPDDGPRAVDGMSLAAQLYVCYTGSDNNTVSGIHNCCVSCSLA